MQRAGSHHRRDAAGMHAAQHTLLAASRATHPSDEARVAQDGFGVNVRRRHRLRGQQLARRVLRRLQRLTRVVQRQRQRARRRGAARRRVNVHGSAPHAQRREHSDADAELEAAAVPAGQDAAFPDEARAVCRPVQSVCAPPPPSTPLRLSRTPPCAQPGRARARRDTCSAGCVNSQRCAPVSGRARRAALREQAASSEDWASTTRAPFAVRGDRLRTRSSSAASAALRAGGLGAARPACHGALLRM